MQRSGGSAPLAVISSRASRRTAAAATEPVEITPPPSCQSPFAGVTLAARAMLSSRHRLDDVRGDRVGRWCGGSTSRLCNSLFPRLGKLLEQLEYLGRE